MTGRAKRLAGGAVLVWACAVSLVLALAADADIGWRNIAFVLLDGAVMFVLGAIVPGAVYLLFKHRIDNPAGLFGIWALMITFVGLGNYAAWVLW